MKYGYITSDGNKCKRNKIMKFERAIIVLRNPFDAIWSEFQRRVSKSHTGGIKRSDFTYASFLANAAELSNHYYNMVSKTYPLMEGFLDSKNLLIVRYEDLRNKEKRLEVLENIVEFIGEKAEKEKIYCAFQLAENKNAKRVVGEDCVSKSEAYNEQLVCSMWNLFGNGASRYGYTMYDSTKNHSTKRNSINTTNSSNTTSIVTQKFSISYTNSNYNCSSTPKIPPVVVGPNGETKGRRVSAKQIGALYALFNISQPYTSNVRYYNKAVYRKSNSKSSIKGGTSKSSRSITRSGSTNNGQNNWNRVQGKRYSNTLTKLRQPIYNQK